jgi:hypothetical protein
LQSVAYVQVLSATRAWYTPAVWGISFIYILHNVGDMTEPWGTPAWGCHLSQRSSDMASEWTQEKRPFLAAAIRHSLTQSLVADRKENTSSDSSSILAWINVATLT